MYQLGLIRNARRIHDGPIVQHLSFDLDFDDWQDREWNVWVHQWVGLCYSMLRSAL
ncbi:uncharacterized protein BJ212DRAFT_523399 [Suillus subaureus]|uniref:Uncharacterized protein n=1 Tax=Suillus subaureus TaxID=48587 RepID=A0A9P7ELD8_9AGAM|nr:uncharacterized protein BJ212DRAFT_523399 [Suillus subaureus]KAG1824410.1 hypothetical protein BJ212DRAFT_523399 [Suillus subaureus]